MMEIQKTLSSLTSVDHFARSVQQLGLQRVKTTSKVVVLNFSEEFASATAQLPEMYQKAVELREERSELDKCREKACKKLKRCMKRGNNVLRIVKQQSAIAYIDDIFANEAEILKKINEQISSVMHQLGNLMIRFGMLCKAAKTPKSSYTPPEAPEPQLEQAHDVPVLNVV